MNIFYIESESEMPDYLDIKIEHYLKHRVIIGEITLLLIIE